MKAPYVMTVADRAGEWMNSQFPTFEAMLSTYRFATQSGRFKDKTFTFGNLDRCDFGDNGLTDAEREEIDG